MTDESDIGLPRPGASIQEIMVRPLKAFLLPECEAARLTKSFDLDGDDSTGYPHAAACARAVNHALQVASRPCAVLVQLWTYQEQGERVTWQVEFKGQDNLGNLEHVQAMKAWAEAGAPIAFIARLTGNELERVQAVVRPVVQLEEVRAERKVMQRIGEVQW